ncbi:MAG: RidA family protein [Chloroflexota bacterium]
MVKRQPVTSPKIQTPKSPFSPATRAGNLLFISGQVALDAEGRLVGRGDIAAQTRQVLENVKALVEAAGGTMDDVVKTTTFIINMGELSQTLAVRREFFQAPYPASTAVQISQLVDPEWLIEIEAIAVLDK